MKSNIDKKIKRHNFIIKKQYGSLKLEELIVMYLLARLRCDK